MSYRKVHQYRRYHHYMKTKVLSSGILVFVVFFVYCSLCPVSLCGTGVLLPGFREVSCYDEVGIKALT